MWKTMVGYWDWGRHRTFGMDQMGDNVLTPAIKQKDLGIETLRAFAIIFVVMSHVIHDAEMKPAADFYEYLNHTLKHIRLPLFTVISGYLYGMRPVSKGRLGMFVRGKFRRILIPLWVVSSLEYFLSSILPGVNKPEVLSGIWKVFFFPYEHFWFLQVIFIIFMIVALFDWSGFLKRDLFLVGFFGVSLLLYLYYKHLGLNLSFFSLGTVTYLLPFFLIGYMFSSRNDLVSRWARSPLLIALLIGGVALQQLDWFLDLPYDSSKRSMVGLLIGLTSAILLLRYRFKLPVLGTVGSYAYAIYLYQGFGTTVGRRIAGLLPEMSPHFYIILVVSAAVVFGMMTEIIVSRIPYLKTLMLGLKTNRNANRGSQVT